MLKALQKWVCLVQVNDFATTVVGYTIKGDACVVEESARQLTGSIDDLLNVWRGRKHTQRDVLAQLHDPSRAPQRPVSKSLSHCKLHQELFQPKNSHLPYQQSVFFCQRDTTLY